MQNFETSELWMSFFYSVFAPLNVNCLFLQALVRNWLGIPSQQELKNIYQCFPAIPNISNIEVFPKFLFIHCLINLKLLLFDPALYLIQTILYLLFKMDNLIIPWLASVSPIAKNFPPTTLNGSELNMKNTWLNQRNTPFLS